MGTMEESLSEPEENGGHEEKKKTRRRKETVAWPLGWVRRGESESAEVRRTEVAEVELMHAPGHAPKPLTGSQPTSLYDKYKRRAQRLLLIAWQKLRNPHFVLRTPDSLTPALSLSLLLFLFLFLSPITLIPPFVERVTGCRRRLRFLRY